MYLKWNEHEKAKVNTFGAVLKSELPEAGLLSAILLQYELKAIAATNTYNAPLIPDQLSKVEVTDGGTKTLHSLSGQCEKAAYFYATKKVAPEYALVHDGTTQRSTIPILFGDYIGDPNHALDLGAWDQVDLEVTNGCSSSYFADGYLKCDILLCTLEDLAAKPAKYYKTQQWRSEKPSADGQFVRHQLPTTEKIRRYFLQLAPDQNSNGSMVHDPRAGANKLDFSYLERKEYVQKGINVLQIMRQNALQYGVVETWGEFPASTSQYYDTRLGRVDHQVATPVGAAATAGYGIVVEGCNDRFCKVASLPTTPESFAVHANGVGYYHTAVLFDAPSGDEMVFLDPSKGGKGPVYMDWEPVYDDHTVKSIVVVPVKQGEA